MSKEYRVYVANQEMFDDSVDTYSDEEFKLKAYENYSLEDFEEAFNMDDIYSPTDYIRIIETEIK